MVSLIQYILDNSNTRNVSKTRTNYPVPWQSHSSLGKKTLEEFLDFSNTFVSPLDGFLSLTRTFIQISERIQNSNFRMF